MTLLNIMLRWANFYALYALYKKKYRDKSYLKFLCFIFLELDTVYVRFFSINKDN